VNRCRVLDVDCFVGDVDRAVEAVIQRTESGRGGYACLANAHVMATAGRNASVRGALDSAWVVFPDGAPIAWLQRRTGADAARRVAGADLMLAVLDRGRQAGLRHFLFGSTNTVLRRLTQRVEADLPGIRIVDAYAPGIGEEHSPEALERVSRAEPHIVWVGLGAPKQELWMQRHGPSFQPALAVGVGAAFDFHAGTKVRAPVWMQRSGLEWLHRLGSEPGRLAGRYIRTNAEFIALALLDAARRRGAL
jgi:N-acetylglucosaminyldiphosphoundecaprenol N-acetyl-beta-D-mannosaminyltransferase